MQLALLSFCAACVSARTTWDDLATRPYTFANYTAEFGKVYASSEEKGQRRAIFEANIKTILSHNVDPQWTYKLGVNEFADRTVEEFKAYHNGHKNINDDSEAFEEAPLHTHIPVRDLPSSLDWRDKNVVTPGR